MQEKNTIDQLKAIISEREKKVKLLENQLELAKQSQPNENFFLNNEKPINYQNECDSTCNRPPSSSNSCIKPKADRSLFNERDSSRYL